MFAEIVLVIPTVGIVKDTPSAGLLTVMVVPHQIVRTTVIVQTVETMMPPAHLLPNQKVHLPCQLFRRFSFFSLLSNFAL